MVPTLLINTISFVQATAFVDFPDTSPEDIFALQVDSGAILETDAEQKHNHDDCAPLEQGLDDIFYKRYQCQYRLTNQQDPSADVKLFLGVTDGEVSACVKSVDGRWIGFGLAEDYAMKNINVFVYSDWTSDEKGDVDIGEWYLEGPPKGTYGDRALENFFLPQKDVFNREEVAQLDGEREFRITFDASELANKYVAVAFGPTADASDVVWSHEHGDMGYGRRYFKFDEETLTVKEPAVNEVTQAPPGTPVQTPDEPVGANYDAADTDSSEAGGASPCACAGALVLIAVALFC